MKKTVLMVCLFVFGAFLFQGCETLKGAKQDAVNTGDNIAQGYNAAIEMDRKFQEKYW
jgi:predicted small secreted protein